MTFRMSPARRAGLVRQVKQALRVLLHKAVLQQGSKRARALGRILPHGIEFGLRDGVGCGAEDVEKQAQQLGLPGW